MLNATSNSRLSQITQPSTAAFMRVFRLSYFYMPASSTPMSTLKQCLYYDPDSKPCASAHRQVKSLDKSFAKLDKLMASENWKGIVDFLLGSASKDASPISPGDGFLTTFDDALNSNVAPAMLELPSNIPISPPRRASPRRQEIMRALCRSYLQLSQARAGERWCDELLGMTDMDRDIDGLLGKGEALLAREEWEEAVHIFERAWDASGGGNREVYGLLAFHYCPVADASYLRFTHGCRKPSVC